MKKSIFYFVFLVLLSCTGDFLFSEATNEEANVHHVQSIANRRSLDEAIEIAKSSISMLHVNGIETRNSEKERTLDLSNGIKAICGTKSRDNDGISDTLLYILNFNDGQGFAVVSAYRQTDGLIAVTESGNYDPSVPTGVPGFDSFMELAFDYVAYESQKPLVSEVLASRTGGPLMVRPVYDTIFYRKIDPRISVRWGQEGRMGQFCPNGISGCANTAAAQIMSYFKHPIALPLNYEDCDEYYTALDWNSMCAHQYTYGSYNRDEADLQIGRLARQLGQTSVSIYGIGKTTTYINDIRYTLITLGYDAGPVISLASVNGMIPGDGIYDFANILTLNKLIFMGGENSNHEGHAWVIDGCNYVKALHRLMATYDGETWAVFQELETCRTCLNHINWGWNGNLNGWFNGWVFNANNSISRDLLNNVENPDAVFVNNFQYFTVTR